MTRFIALVVLGCIGIIVGTLEGRPAADSTSVSPGADVAISLEEIARTLAGAALVESTSLPVKTSGDAGTIRVSGNSDI